MQSKAKTVAEYLRELPADRRRAVSAVRQVIKKNLPKGYKEEMAFGMIGYVVPLSRYPETYNGQPLMYAALASQKNYMSVYLMSIYAGSKDERRFRAAFKKAGKKLDMGKCCVRFKKLEDIPLDVVGETIGGTTPQQLIKIYEDARKKYTKKGR